MNKNAAGRAFPNLLQGAKFNAKSVKNEGQIDPKSSPNRAQIHPNRDKVLPRRPPDPIGEKNVRFCLKCSPKWSQNTSQMEAKSSENRVRKRVDFCPCFFIVFGWFLGGKSSRKLSKIRPRRRSGEKTQFSKNVGFTIVKPSFSTPETSPNGIFWRGNRLRRLSRRGVEKTVGESVIFYQFGHQNGALFEKKRYEKTSRQKEPKRYEKRSPTDPPRSSRRQGRAPL